MILRTSFSFLLVLVGSSSFVFSENVEDQQVSSVEGSGARSKRQSFQHNPNYQYVSFDLPNNTNPFQFAPPPPQPNHDALLSAYPPQFGNSFQGHQASNFLGHNPNPNANSAIRRFPQYPNAVAPGSQLGGSDEPLISVLSGSHQFHPSQSVSWNPPPTIVPPGPPPSRQPQLLSRSPEAGGVVYQPPQHQQPPPPPQPSRESSPSGQSPPESPPSGRSVNSRSSNNYPLEESLPSNKRVNLQAGNTNVVGGSATPSSTTAAPPTTASGKEGKEGKKDDVVIYYYYYYDDDKNKTDGLDTIPSLEGFDAPKPKPGKVIIKNENAQHNFAPPPQQIIPLRVDSRIPGVSSGQVSKPQQPKDTFREVTERPPPSSTTELLRSTPSSQHSAENSHNSLISNIFRYGSTSVAPPSHPTTPSEPVFNSDFAPQLNKAVTSSEQSINKLPSSTSPDKVDFGSDGDFGDHTTPLQTVAPSSTTWRTTLPSSTTRMTTTTTTTTTTTPAPTTTTTTTTPAPSSEAAPEDTGRRRTFGNRRPGIRNGADRRTNPLNRARSSSTTTSTTTQAPTTERRSFTRPSSSLNNQRRLPSNRFRKRPGFGSNTSEQPEENGADSSTPSGGVTSTTTTTTPAPRNAVESSSSSYSSRNRFGGRSRFAGGRGGSNRGGESSSSSSTTTTTTTPSSATPAASNPVASTRRPFTSRGRPQLRGGNNRPPFGRTRTTKAPEAEAAVTPDPSAESSASTAPADGESSSASSSSASPEGESSPSPAATEAPAANDSAAESTEPVSSTTEKPGPRGRQRALFGARPKPNLFGRRGQQGRA